MPCCFGLAASRIPAVRWRTRADLLALLEEARILLETQWENPLTTEQLATRCGLSQGRFIRLFSQVHGEPPRSYRARMRLERAAWLLKETDLTVSEIASEVGFSSPGSLCRSHKAVYRVSPLASRNLSRQKLSI
jgi:transcriptional regulator GlxA family with amidase domain